MRRVRSTVTASATLIAALVVAVPAPAPAGARSSGSNQALLLHFDGGTRSTPDLTSSGWAPVTTEVADANGGTVTRVDHGAGGSARFEPFDGAPPAELAVLVVRPGGEEDPFSPRRRPFTFGAAFNLDPVSEGSDHDNGNNVVQRGLYTDGAQYKLQVDDGRLSCHVRGRAGAVFVSSKFPVTPERWYQASCTRKGDSVTLRLVERTSDGTVRHRWTRSNDIGSLAFAQTVPLSVGGKLDPSGEVVQSSSDQFNGRVDSVFFRLLDQ